MYKKILFILFITLVSINTTRADENEVLKGISGVRVFVVVSEDADKAFLTKSKVTTEVELLLRQYGINVLTQEEFEKHGVALIIKVWANYENSVSGQPQGYFSVVSLEIKEWCYLSREVSNEDDPKLYLMTTWDNEHSISGPTRNLREKSMNVVKDITKSFINSYLAANK